MLKILSNGDDKHRLEDADGDAIGWINGRTVGFRGFPSETDAGDAAIAAWRALDASLRQWHSGWPIYDPAVDQLTTVHDGAYEWFFDGTRAIARLLRPQRRAADYSYGIELVLPSYVTEGTAITAACNIANAVTEFRVCRPTAL